MGCTQNEVTTEICYTAKSRMHLFETVRDEAGKATIEISERHRAAASDSGSKGLHLSNGVVSRRRVRPRGLQSARAGGKFESEEARWLFSSNSRVCAATGVSGC